MTSIHRIIAISTNVVLTQISPQVLAGDASGIQELYAEYCSVCHGDQGDGKTHATRGLNPPPRDFTQPGMKAQLPREYMITVVSEGKPGTAMVGWNTQLSRDQIEGLVDYIRTNFMGEASVGKLGKAPAGQPHSGKAIFAATCSVCHGEDGAGALWGKTSLNPPPVDFTQVTPEQGMSRERMIASVTHGRPGTAMTAFASQLTSQEIETVVDYIRTTFMPEEEQASADTGATGASMAVMGKKLSVAGIGGQTITHGVNFDLPMPDNLEGDTAMGAASYLQNCSACHGVQGKGDGPRAYFIFPRPRNFVSPENRARFNRPALFSAIKNGVVGREMPAWERVFSDQQIADVAEYVFQTFIKSEEINETAKTSVQ